MIAIVIAGGGLVLVAVIGIVAAIAIPNFITAKERAKQKRTLADIRMIGTAIESYRVDHESYPNTTDLSEVGALLSPTYIRSMPETDGWNNRLRYFCRATDDDGACLGYMIVSPAGDGVFEHDDPNRYEPALTTNFYDDIVYADGEFLRQPRE